MSSQERRANGNKCPRGCGGTIHNTDRTQFNAISLVDGKQICPNCYLNETVQRFLAGRS